MSTTIVLLMGFAGTGKYTIGCELSRLTGAKLIDNHLINNSVFTALNADGVTPLPAGVWAKVGAIREVVYETIVELAPVELSFIFTMQLLEGVPDDLVAYNRLAQLAQQRESVFLPVRLTCEVNELCRRIELPTRRERLKQNSAAGVAATLAKHGVLNPSHPNLKTIDVTKISPTQSALLILEEMTNESTDDS